MNKAIGSLFSAIALLSFNPASANDGILSTNAAEPYFTTPQEFRVLEQRVRQSVSLGVSSPATAGQTAVHSRDIKPQDPDRGAKSGK